MLNDIYSNLHQIVYDSSVLIHIASLEEIYIRFYRYFLEDDEIVRENFTMILKRYFSNVIVSKDGLDAIEKFQQFPENLNWFDKKIYLEVNEKIIVLCVTLN